MVVKKVNKLGSSVTNVTTIKKSNSVTTTKESATTSSTPSSTTKMTVVDKSRKQVTSSTSEASPVNLDFHDHCDNCINVATCKNSTCPIVPCDCGHKLHQCKIEDHASLCREANFKHCTGTVVRKVKKVETTKMTSDKPGEVSAPVNKRENFSRQQSIHAVREPSPVEEVKLSVDKKKVQSQFSVGDSGDAESKCKRCEKTVYPAERIRAEKAQYHKQCFRCIECSKTLSAESYHSNEGELYCANHFKQLFQPKANFENETGPQNHDATESDTLDNLDGKQRKHEMIIRENEPMQLSPDVVRCDTRSNMEDLESLHLNLGSLKSRFENQSTPNAEEAVKRSQSVADRGALSRSASVLKRLEKYQSAVAGETKADSDEDEEADDDMTKIDLSKQIEVCKEMNELKNKWESGNVAKDGKEPAKDELASLRKRICLGRSESMKVVYEKAVKDANKNETSAPEEVTVTHAFANNLKKKFETGEVIKEQEAERLEQVRSEKDEDLSVCQETGIAQQAKNMFKQLDKEIMSRPQAPLQRSASESRWTRPANEIQNRNIEVVKSGEPGQDGDVEVETKALSERFKFFENFKEGPTSRKEFKMTPPRELEKENSPVPVAERNPDVVVSSNTIDDIPKVDTATKMRQKFQQLCESSTEKAPQTEVQRPKPMKRITPPRETFQGNVVENTPVVDPDVVKCSYKVDDDIQVEADMAKSMRARFENWGDDEHRKDSVSLEDDCLPVDNITKNMKAVFEANSNKKPQTNGQNAVDRNKPKVNRFV